MSDAEKVIAFAKRLGPSTPIVLRWEGAGDCSHVFEILDALSNAKYAGNRQNLKFDAYVNLYEAKDSKVAKDARARLKNLFVGAEYGQTYTLTYEIDLVRESKSITQPAAHIMFVRNIMPTDESKTKSVIDAEALTSLHRGAVRQRAGSLRGDGQLKLGMSGAPGLAVTDRPRASVQDLFVDFPDLNAVAKEKGLMLKGSPEDRAIDDAGDGEVMLNGQRGVETKRTYYLTFIPSAKAQVTV